MTPWHGNAFRINGLSREESDKGLVKRSIDIFVVVRMNKLLEKGSGWQWFEALWRLLTVVTLYMRTFYLWQCVRKEGMKGCVDKWSHHDMCHGAWLVEHQRWIKAGWFLWYTLHVRCKANAWTHANILKLKPSRTNLFEFESKYETTTKS